MHVLLPQSLLSLVCPMSSSARPYAAADLGKAALKQGKVIQDVPGTLAQSALSLLKHRIGFKDLFIFI